MYIAISNKYRKLIVGNVADFFKTLPLFILPPPSASPYQLFLAPIFNEILWRREPKFETCCCDVMDQNSGCPNIV